MTRTRLGEAQRPTDWQKTRSGATGTGNSRSIANSSPNLSISSNTTSSTVGMRSGTDRTQSTRKKEYEQPEGLVAAFLWRFWMKLQTTFALSMLDTWEIVLIFVITGSIGLLITAALIRFIPHALLFVSQQAHVFLDSVGFGNFGFGFGGGLQNQVRARAREISDLAKGVFGNGGLGLMG